MEVLALEDAAVTKRLAVKQKKLAQTLEHASNAFVLPEAYSRHANVTPDHPLMCEFSEDPGYLQQYYYLRTRMFIREWNLAEFDGDKDEYDDICDHVVVRRGNFVIGGARMFTHHPTTQLPLPMECEEFSLQAALPHIDFSKLSFAEWGRVAILPEFRSRELMIDIWKRFFEKSKQTGVNCGFWIAPAPQARNYLQVARALGVGSKVFHDVMIPDKEEYEGIRMYLGACWFQDCINL